MDKSTKTTKFISIYFFMFFISLVSAQKSKSTNVLLPKIVFGEWYNDTGNREYNGLLIHSDFIEWNYRAFLYQKIVKTNNNSYSFSAKDLLGDVVNGELTIISKDTIQLKRGNSQLTTYVSRNEPKDSKRITFAEVPKMIKKQWFTTDGENNLDFDVTTKKFSFRNKDYKLDKYPDANEQRIQLIKTQTSMIKESYSSTFNNKKTNVENCVVKILFEMEYNKPKP